MDLRWVGVYRQDADTVRIGITLWDPVRPWMLRPPGDGHRQLWLISRGLADAGIYGEGYIYFDPGPDRWVLAWIDSGSVGLQFRLPVAHPDPYRFQVRFPTEHVSGLRLAEHATGFRLVSCDLAALHGLPGCSTAALGSPPIADLIPSDWDDGPWLDPA